MTTQKTPESQLVNVSAEKTPSELWFEGDPKREKALELAFGGASNKLIATQLDVHRNTVSNWRDNPYFMEALAKLHGDRLGAMRARRAQQTSNFADRLAALADNALTTIEQKVKTGNPVALSDRQTLRDWMQEYRATRQEERIDSGDNGVRVQHSGVVGVGVFGEVNHTHSIKGSSFKEFTSKALRSKVIDIKAIEESKEEPLVALVEAVLGDTDLLDIIQEEDRALLLSGGDQ